MIKGRETKSETDGHKTVSAAERDGQTKELPAAASERDGQTKDSSLLLQFGDKD